MLTAGQTDRYARGLIAQKGASAVQALVKKWAADPDTLDVDAAVDDALGVPDRGGEGCSRRSTLRSQRETPLAATCGRWTWRSSSSSRASVRERCTTCQRLTTRHGPERRLHPPQLPRHDRRPSSPTQENYDVWLMGRPFVMVSAEEHTAQVPGEVRNQIEQDFKSRHGRTNCLVATPTLEMGVNIGALDMALMRNVPPRPSNYWQRAGRAGREERMAVVVTYCRRSNHDRYFFDDPLRLLGGAIEAPTFNLRNPLMVAKHIRSAILSELLLRSTEPAAGASGSGTSSKALFPTFIRSLPAGRGQPLPGDARPARPRSRRCSTRSRDRWRIGWSPCSPSTGPRRPPNWPTVRPSSRSIDETADATRCGHQATAPPPDLGQDRPAPTCTRRRTPG